jgi:hypothetical protein
MCLCPVTHRQMSFSQNSLVVHSGKPSRSHSQWQYLQVRIKIISDVRYFETLFWNAYFQTNLLIITSQVSNASNAIYCPEWFQVLFQLNCQF